MSNHCANNDNNKITDFTKLSDTAVPTVLLIFFCSIATSTEKKKVSLQKGQLNESYLTILNHGITSYSTHTLKRNTE